MCIYFHFASVQQLDKKDDERGEEDLSIYLDAKKAATIAILRYLNLHRQLSLPTISLISSRVETMAR